MVDSTINRPARIGVHTIEGHYGWIVLDERLITICMKDGHMEKMSWNELVNIVRNYRLANKKG